jgi:hypothetical protein
MAVSLSWTQKKAPMTVRRPKGLIMGVAERVSAYSYKVAKISQKTENGCGTSGEEKNRGL